MDHLSFEDFDNYLLAQKGKIIHQVWFDNINPNKRAGQKIYNQLKKYKDTWLLKNPDWLYVCWDVKRSYDLIKHFYKEHIELYKNYKYNIQRCDVVRYFFLHRYGGLYADMDYVCNRPMTEAFDTYTKNLYLVQTPNTINKEVMVSNSFMYSKPQHPFWRTFFLELEKCKNVPYYYSKHVEIMCTTGPLILNRVFNIYKTRYILGYLPYELFHPYGLNTDIISFNNTDVYAFHLGKGSWESNDSKILIFIYKEYKIILFIFIMLIIPIIVNIIKD